MAISSAIIGWMIGSAMLVMAGGNSSPVTASVTINNYCAFTVGNTAINFGALNPGSNTIYSSNVITVTDSGNLGSNILTSGNSWTFASNTFGVTNTVWSSANVLYGSGTALTGTSADTAIVVTTSATNSIYFGLGVPAGQAPGTYSQTIEIISSC